MRLLCSNNRTWLGRWSAATTVKLYRMITAEDTADKAWLLQCGTSALAWEPHGHRMVIAEAGSDSQVCLTPGCQPGIGLRVQCPNPQPYTRASRGSTALQHPRLRLAGAQLLLWMQGGTRAQVTVRSDKLGGAFSMPPWPPGIWPSARCRPPACALSSLPRVTLPASSHHPLGHQISWLPALAGQPDQQPALLALMFSPRP